MLQWAPSDAVTATVDYVRSELDLEHRMSDMSAWFSNGAAPGQSSTWTDGPQASPLVYQEDLNNADFAMGMHRDGRKSENSSVGFNL